MARAVFRLRTLVSLYLVAKSYMYVKVHLLVGGQKIQVVEACVPTATNVTYCPAVNYLIHLLVFTVSSG